MFSKMNRRRKSARRVEIQDLESRLLLTSIIEIEPNDSIITSQFLSDSQSEIDGSISTLSDIDFYSFNANAGTTISVNIQALNPDDLPLNQFDPTIGLFDSSGSMKGTK